METSIDRLEIVVAGFGSPHGDDQVGWQVLAELARRPHVPARIVPIHEATQLIGELDGCRKLLIIDACRGSGPPGTISRFVWPDPRIRRHHDRSTHQIGLSSALELADQLGKLPAEVVVFGIEGQSDETIGPISGEVSQALDELKEIVLSEMEGAVHA